MTKILLQLGNFKNLITIKFQENLFSALVSQTVYVL